jgi:serine/threonine protein kinase
MEGGFQPGTVLLEKYRVEGLLGRGGMGVVLRVTHLHLGEELAIKILSPEAGGGPEVHARFTWPGSVTSACCQAARRTW